MNLLPQDFKKELIYEAWRRFFLYIGTYTVLISVVGIILLLPSFFLLQFQIDILEGRFQTLKASEDHKKMIIGREEVNRINSTLETFVGFHESRSAAVPLIEDIINRVPDSVVLTELGYTFPISLVEGSFTVRGRANDRDALDRFRDSLEESPVVSGEILIPPESYKDETNISFNLTVPINVRQ